MKQIKYYWDNKINNLKKKNNIYIYWVNSDNFIYILKVLFNLNLFILLKLYLILFFKIFIL